MPPPAQQQQARRPKALLFDIGGVCVISPMSAILAYERENGIPPGWVNFAISRSKPDGAWHKLERGDIDCDARFFAAFKADLENAAHWPAFMGMLAARKASKAAKGGRSGSASQQLSKKDLPPVPTVDAETMFWRMMYAAREPDPYMAPALRKLRASGQFLLGALSNTVIFPPGHPLSAPIDDPKMDVKANFDVFVSSAHVGLRKPHRPVYELAMRWMGDAYRSGEWGGGGKPAGELAAEDVVFLDDIGENLKGAKEVGMQTIKVPLGRTKEVVEQLERMTGLSLLEPDSGKSRL